MRESSPAVGGVMVGTTILIALVYALGDGGRVLDLVSALAARGAALFNAAYLAASRAIGG